MRTSGVPPSRSSTRPRTSGPWDQLIQATRDNDWWVSERAVDALAEIGSKRARAAALEMLQAGNAKAMPVVVRALGKLGDAQDRSSLLPLLARPRSEIRIEAIQALAQLADDRAPSRSRGLQTQVVIADQTVARAALRALAEMEVRRSSPAVGALTSRPRGRRDRADAPACRPPQPRPHAADPEDGGRADASSRLRSGSRARLDIRTLKTGDIIEGRYKYIDRIGRGAFGTVLLMEDTVVDERLILKFLNPNVAEDEEVMKRFVHELRYSRKITHKNVIRIYDFLYIQGNYAISMEYFPSHTLGSEIVNEKPVELKRAMQFGIDICTGMTVAHQVGIVHRDLKPANVLINQEALLKIVDFGVAAAQREGDTQLTKTGYVIGSPKYMAPEQILGKKVDERADIYALGVMLYEMVTGVPPYSRGDHMSVMYQHVQGKARVAQDINPNLPPGLSDVVMQAPWRWTRPSASRPWTSCAPPCSATSAERPARARVAEPQPPSCESSCVRSNFRTQVVDFEAQKGQNNGRKISFRSSGLARIDAFLKLGTQQGCSDVHLAVGVPPMLRLYGDLMPIKFRELRAGELDGYITEILTGAQNEHFNKGNDLDFSYVSERRRTLSRQRVPQGHRRRRHLPFHSDLGADAGETGAAADGHEAVRLPPGHGAGDRLDRHRQVDDARGDDRSPQPDP